VNSFIQGLGFGLILQVSVGPVCIAVLQRGIAHGFWHALALVAGAALVDALYILLSVAGISTVLQNEVVLRVVGVIGALLLVWFGIRYLRTDDTAPSTGDKDALLLPNADTSERNQANESLQKSLSFGVVLTLTNPLTILFWGAVLGAMMASRSFVGAGGIFGFAAGCIAATFLFLTAVAAAGHFLERLLSDKVQFWLNRAVGLFLIGFAIKLVVDLF
jgi:threonine/homoserine/homoserine lactone efflux protein